MKKLRSLKDIEKIKGFKYSDYIIEELKAEAVKWVKKLRVEFKDNSGKTDFIKEFFNLTEEDLK